MSRIDRNTLAGYSAGIAAGVSYGMNPLFAKHLLAEGVSVTSMLSMRYGIAALIMLAWILLRRESLRLTLKQAGWMLVLGLLFSASSFTLFESYRFIPSGLGTTLVYLYPVLVAITMMFMKVFPSWQVWVSIFATFAGVALLSVPAEGEVFGWQGIAFACTSALVYAWYLVIVNSTRAVRDVSNHVLTFYALMVGTVWFVSMQLGSGEPLLDNVSTGLDWLCLGGLAIFPTLISLLTLAISTRKIGATKTSVLGVFEPVTAILIGTLAFGEPFSARIAVGLTVCIAAILFMILCPGKK